MVSVCIATYNGEKYIREQIDSILKQLSEDDEIIISDDGSSDDTLEILRLYNDSRIKIFKNPNPKCYTTNFENALSKARGDYILLCDQDDVWVDIKVKRCVEELQNVDFVMTNAYVTDENLNILIQSRNLHYNVKKGFLRNLIKTRYLGCCLAFRRILLDFCLPFPKNNCLCLHDYWLSLAAEYEYKTTIIEEPLIYYRRHTQNTSSGGETHSKIYKILLIRIYLLWSVISRSVLMKAKGRNGDTKRKDKNR